MIDWISFNDRMPEKEGFYLLTIQATREHREICTGHPYFEIGWWEGGAFRFIELKFVSLHQKPHYHGELMSFTPAEYFESHRQGEKPPFEKFWAEVNLLPYLNGD